MQPELCLSESDLCRVVEQTDGFSFAYLKEHCLSSMTQWIAEPVVGKMGMLMLNRAALLRAQMSQPSTTLNELAMFSD
ncbi:MAG: hypothetical protein L0226_15315 [Acidobacteria bacterium]|nr:hypothetical protein [Acidobacteriota bacterium]